MCSRMGLQFDCGEGRQYFDSAADCVVALRCFGKRLWSGEKIIIKHLKVKVERRQLNHAESEPPFGETLALCTIYQFPRIGTK